METIFDHKPTAQEIEECGFLNQWQRIRHGVDFTLPIIEDSYKKEVKEEGAIFDIALLMEYREEMDEAAKYWAKIPDIAQEYGLGFDYIQIPISR